MNSNLFSIHGIWIAKKILEGVFNIFRNSFQNPILGKFSFVRFFFKLIKFHNRTLKNDFGHFIAIFFLFLTVTFSGGPEILKISDADPYGITFGSSSNMTDFDKKNTI